MGGDDGNESLRYSDLLMNKGSRLADGDSADFAVLRINYY